MRPVSFAFPVALEGGGWVLETHQLAYPGATETVGEPERIPMRPIDTASPAVWEKIGGAKLSSDRGWALVENSIIIIAEDGKVTHYLDLRK